MIQVDPTFSEAALLPTFYFSLDDTPATTITQAQEKKLDEELEKLEHKLRIATTKKKTEKIEKLNIKISRVRALLNGEQPLEGSLTDTESEAGGLSGANSETGDVDYYDSNSESEYSDSESTPRSGARARSRKRGTLTIQSGSPSHSTSSSPIPNTLNFSLEAEATCRILAYAIFKPASSEANNSSVKGAKNTTGSRSNKMKKRQQRRDSTPLVGVGKFVLFEQQNKDVVKDLQYSAEVFLRTSAGESAFCRAVGRMLPPPSPLSHGAPRFPMRAAIGATPDLIRDPKHGKGLPVAGTASAGALDGHSVPRSGRDQTDIGTPISHASGSHPMLDIIPDESTVSSISGLLIPIEESPTDFRGWSVNLSLPTEIPEHKTAEVWWCPAAPVRNVIAVSCDVEPHESEIQRVRDVSADGSNGQGRFLLEKVYVTPGSSVRLSLKWCFADGAGFASSTALSSALNRALIEGVSKEAKVTAGVLEFVVATDHRAATATGNALRGKSVSSLGVFLVKSTQHALFVETDTIDLGESLQNTEIEGEFILGNRSLQAAQFLLIASSSRDNLGSSVPSGVPATPGGEIILKNPTGVVDAGSQTVVRFSFKGTTPGQHCDTILIRNLNDRTDTSSVTVSARIIRPVYVRIPELDPHATGNLEVLNIGPCYVTPEMQDTTVDSPNLSLKFSKVHKLTLHSQVSETLIVWASSNLKTQCYVYEDARLHREATNVVLRGLESVDLYVAFRPRLSGDAFRTGSSRELVGGIRVQLFTVGVDILPAQSVEEKKEVVAEFTVKFVGLAGVSIARVSPSQIDFGVEYNAGMLQTCQMHEGQFELINVSKTLPLAYRLFVTDVPDEYSDDDDSLHVSLKHEKGEIGPAETGIIEFRVMAYTNGLFRRRILVENIHYPGKISFVDVTLFVDSGDLSCTFMPSPSSAQDIERPTEIDGLSDISDVRLIDVGTISVIKLEDELSDVASMTESELELTNRKYRIYRDNTFGGTRSGNVQLRLTNTTSRALIIRPFSSLPLVFHWGVEQASDSESLVLPWDELVARSTSLNEVRKLHVEPLAEKEPALRSVFFGDGYRLAPNASSTLSFQFARIATTTPLPSNMIEAGKLCSFVGMLGLQSFSESTATESPTEACTLKTIRVIGNYGEPSLQIVEKQISLGKIGYTVGWESSSFSVTVTNSSDLDDLFTIANLPEFVRILNVQGAERAEVLQQTDQNDPVVPSLRSLALQTDSNDVGARGRTAWKLPTRATCLIEMELTRSVQVRLV